jgi:hypothetical protein
MTDKEALIKRLKTTCLGLDAVDPLRLLVNDVVAALREPEQEPVATLEDLEQEIYQNTRNFVSRDVMEWMLKRYYTHPPQRTEQEPVAWMVWSENNVPALTFTKPADKYVFDALYTHPPQRTWIGLEGAEFGWFCHTDFLNARKYTKKQREHICNQLMSEAQSWDIEQYTLMMHDSTKLKENT